MEITFGVALSEKQICVHALEVAVDLFLNYDRFNLCDSSVVTLGSKACAFDAVKSFDLAVGRVGKTRQVRSGIGGFASTNGILVQHCHGFTFAGEKVRGRHASNSRSNNTNIGAKVFLEGRSARNLDGG